MSSVERLALSVESSQAEIASAQHSARNTEPSTHRRTLLILAGGTGGHIMPGLAIAEVMQARGWNIRWLGTAHGMENTLVPKAGIPLDTIAFAGLRGKGLLHTLKGGLQLVSGFFHCLKLMGEIRPDAVLGMGGYVTVPAGLSAVLRGKPLVLVNSDSAPLLSNQFLTTYAKRVLYGLPGHIKPDAPETAKEIWTGSPVRASIAAIPEPALRFADRTGLLKVLVVGGSLGATVLNRTVPKALALIPETQRPIVCHQSGALNLEALRQNYIEAGVDAEVVAFIDDMAQRYAEVDVVICRAGAITLNELMVAGVPSILVPLTVSTTSHQRNNAVMMQEAGAAIHLPQTEMTPEVLADLIKKLCRERLLKMAKAARKLGRPDATERVADIIETVVKQ